MSTSKRRRGRRKGGGSGSSGGGATAIALPPGSVPSDEQLDEELRELEEQTQGKYDLAKKDDITLPMLQKMKGDDLVKLGKKEKIGDPQTLPKQKLVFEILSLKEETPSLCDPFFRI